MRLNKDVILEEGEWYWPVILDTDEEEGIIKVRICKYLDIIIRDDITDLVELKISGMNILVMDVVTRFHIM